MDEERVPFLGRQEAGRVLGEHPDAALFRFVVERALDRRFAGRDLEAADLGGDRLSGSEAPGGDVDPALELRVFSGIRGHPPLAGGVDPEVRLDDRPVSGLHVGDADRNWVRLRNGRPRQPVLLADPFDPDLDRQIGDGGAPDVRDGDLDGELVEKRDRLGIAHHGRVEHHRSGLRVLVDAELGEFRLPHSRLGFGRAPGPVSPGRGTAREQADSGGDAGQTRPPGQSVGRSVGRLGSHCDPSPSPSAAA